jgi:hypothetical protein
MKTFRRNFTFALVATLVALPSLALGAPRVRKNSQKLAINRRTQLRPETPTFVIVTSSRGLELRHLNVEVHNSGSHQATDIAVFAEVGGSLVFSLRGPTRLPPNQSGFYFLRSRTPVPSQSPLRIITRCANCRR